MRTKRMNTVVLACAVVVTTGTALRGGYSPSPVEAAIRKEGGAALGASAACAAGSTGDCISLGNSLVRKFPEAALEQYRRGCSMQNASACALAAELLARRARRSDQAVLPAIRLGRKACILGSPQGCWTAGDIGYRMARNDPGKRQVALGMIAKACRGGVVAACRSLWRAAVRDFYGEFGSRLKSGDRGRYWNRKDYNYAMLGSKIACENGDDDACILYENVLKRLSPTIFRPSVFSERRRPSSRRAQRDASGSVRR